MSIEPYFRHKGELSAPDHSEYDFTRSISTSQMRILLNCKIAHPKCLQVVDESQPIYLAIFYDGDCPLFYKFDSHCLPIKKKRGVVRSQKLDFDTAGINLLYEYDAGNSSVVVRIGNEAYYASTRTFDCLKFGKRVTFEDMLLYVAKFRSWKDFDSAARCMAEQKLKLLIFRIINFYRKGALGVRY